ncbi:EAL domain-containing protein [Pseudomarimonas salicorniae]|uniref:EAL domain-containing protein n=1 Tax=Pseudomarimonas salicorniae TaxID=2933270 RepID=A0ABT0GLI2_9GAMM|nr:EAL domain-containing protein [Lysobacter sp. CAU 1642]MCK7595366.1 EAL domain-containing protein [Lysobacter sp. CAU 1642]
MLPDSASALISGLPTPLLLLDADGTLVLANQQAQELVCEIDSVRGRPLQACLPPGNALTERMEECRRSRQALPIRLDFATAGQERLHATLTHIADGTPRGCYVACLKTHGEAVKRFVMLREQLDRLDAEVARRSLAESALRDREAWLRVVLHSIADGVLTADQHLKITWMNPTAASMCGWTESEALGKPVEQVLDLVHEQTRRPAPNPLTLALRERRTTGMQDDTVLLSRDGREIAVEDSAAPIFDDRGGLAGGVIVFHDVSERRRLAREMAERAAHDSLTGLLNRAEFEARLAGALQTSGASDEVHSLMYVDLDHFKVVNDTCGHPVGDQMLREVSTVLARAVRVTDVIARLGGDEFGVLLPNCDLEAALRVCDTLLKQLGLFRFEHEGRRFRVGASIGLVLVDGSVAPAEVLMQAADTACYAAKEAGGQQVKIWQERGAAAEVRGRMVWVQRLNEALEDDAFELFLQRIEPIHPGRGRAHVEALLRLRDPDGSLIPPGTFLPAAERFRMGPAIDRWVLGSVIKRLALDPRADVELAVNFCGQSIGDRSFRNDVLRMLREAGEGCCGRLCVEVTETSVVGNLTEAATFMARLRELGVSVALDDFGAGASSFTYLRRLPIDLLKIDGQFIEGLPEDRLSGTAIRCFVEAAHIVGARTIAERVESESALEALRLLGVDLVQGYLCHRPEPWEAVWPHLPRLLAARSIS